MSPRLLQDTLAKSTEKCAGLNAEMEQCKLNSNIEKARHRQLVDLINKHVDEKISIKTYNIQEWLEDACKHLDATVYVIERHGGTYICDNIPCLDLINAAAEAVMSKGCIEALAQVQLSNPDFSLNSSRSSPYLSLRNGDIDIRKPQKNNASKAN